MNRSFIVYVSFFIVLKLHTTVYSYICRTLYINRYSWPVCLINIILLRFQDNCSRGKLPPNPKTNTKPNINPNRGTIFLGGQLSEAAVHRCSSNQVFLKISQYLQLDSLFNKVVGIQTCNFIKEETSPPESQTDNSTKQALQYKSFRIPHILQKL